MKTMIKIQYWNGAYANGGKYLQIKLCEQGGDEKIITSRMVRVGWGLFLGMRIRTAVRRLNRCNSKVLDNVTGNEYADE